MQDEILGHVPYNLVKSVSQFLMRSANKGFATVTGSKDSHGAGYGLEVPVMHCLCRPGPYIRKIDIDIRAN